MKPAFGLDDQLCFALHAASRAMTRAYQPQLEALGVTYPQYLVLLLLWEQDGVRVSQLGERLQLDSATLTPLLKRLQARGLIERRRSTEDERVVQIFLTPAGRALQSAAPAVAEAMQCKSGLSRGELVQLREQLNVLTARLQPAGK